MRDVALRALDTARTRGAAYADVRIVHFRSENVTVRNQNVEALVVDESLGFGVRVIVDGYWGFAASNNLTTREADRVAAEAWGQGPGERAELEDDRRHPSDRGPALAEAPALRAADIGISVDSAVDIAKEAADIILLEKSLMVLDDGVIEGRTTFCNMLKYIRMTASSNFVGCSTGKSAGLAPFRILSTKYATRR